MLGGVGDVIFTADHVGDCHGGVINHHHKVVEGIADLVCRCPSGDHHVATKIAARPAHLTAHQIVPSDGCCIVDPEADRGFPAFGDVGPLLLGAEVAVAVVVAGGTVFCCLPLPHFGELGFRCVTPVGQSFLKQRGNGLPVLTDPFALHHRLGVRLNAQPTQTLEDVLGVFRLAAFFVGVFNAQQELTAVMPGVQPIEHGCAGGADVEGARGARGETHTHRTTSCHHRLCLKEVKTGLTGLEPATSAVTGRCSNRLNYSPRLSLRFACVASATSKVSAVALPSVNWLRSKMWGNCCGGSMPMRWSC